MLLPRRWAYLTAASAFILYGSVLELTYFGIISSYSTTHPHVRLLQAIMLITLVAYFAVAYLTGLLSAMRRHVDVKLKYSRGAPKNRQARTGSRIQSIRG